MEDNLLETAPKKPDNTGITPTIILGFSPDEEGYSLPSREGFWNVTLNKWVVSIDPNWGGHGQPTHWQELPEPPQMSDSKPSATEIIEAIPEMLGDEYVSLVDEAMICEIVWFALKKWNKNSTTISQPMGASLELPTMSETKKWILEVLKEPNPPKTIEGIYKRLRELKLGKILPYRHQMSSGVWQLNSEGLVSVLSGHIYINQS